jgi:hypothetical protein
MELSVPDLTLGQPNLGITLHLAPTPWSVQLLQASKSADSATDGYRLDVGDLADDLEGHDGSYLPAARTASPINEKSANTKISSEPPF